MSRYRKVDPRIWNDAKFRELSDSAKLVFFMLLTHPSMTSIGAMRATVAGLAEELGWELEAFLEAFREPLVKGMVEQDKKACLIALPNFVKYNPPESPNVVKAWASALDLLPECDLKIRVIARSVAFAKGMNEAFAKALPEAFAKPMPYQKQEQEQEQEQENKNTPIPPEGSILTRQKTERKKREGEPLQAYLDRCKAEGIKSIPEDDPIFTYITEVGLTEDMLRLAWFIFKDRYLEQQKLQKDWRAHFRNAVKGNWFKIWFLGNDGSAGLTTAGIQAQREMESRIAA